MDRQTLLSKFNELTNSSGNILIDDDHLLVVQKWNWYYDKALSFQQIARDYILDNPNKRIVILCNHPTCFTMGRGLQKKSGKVIDGLVETDELSGLPFPLYKINRGGGLTYHYPGQLIIYPILKLGGKNPSLSDLADNIFETLINIIWKNFEFKLSSKRGDLIGLWTETEPSQKVASFGIGIERFVTQHGVAFNLENGEIFNVLGKMFPCGIQGSTYSYLNNFNEIGASVGSLSELFISEINSIFRK